MIGPRGLVRLLVAAVVTSTLVGIPATGQAVPVVRGDSSVRTPANVLRVGERLVADGARDSLRNGEFQLIVTSVFLSLDQTLAIPGPAGHAVVITSTWFADDDTGEHQANHDRTTLGLRRNGNLVLADSRGDVLWTSRTAGTGTNNRVVLTASGDLRMYNGHDKLVWHADTGPRYLAPGKVLASGRRMIDRYNPRGFPPDTLTMQRDGNLVRRCGVHVIWQTRTHVAGSSLKLRKDGGLVVLGPGGRTIWSAHSGGHGPYVFFDMYDLAVKSANQTDHVFWQAPAGDEYHPEC